jgi:hypothetical protein
MDQLEAGHPKWLVEEAHRRMLTRTPIRHGAALAVVHHARTEPTHHKPFQQAVEVGSKDDPDLTVRLRPGALLPSDDYGSRVERTATLHPLWHVHESGDVEL